MKPQMGRISKLLMGNTGKVDSWLLDGYGTMIGRRSIKRRTAKKVRKLAKQQEEGEGNEVH
jgi:hypothetical protein